MPPVPPVETIARPSAAEEILACAAALRAAVPDAEPVAFWDFDGTLFEGDCSEGFTSGSFGRVPGLVESAVAAGWSVQYPAAEGFGRCWDDYCRIMENSGAAAAYVHFVRIFAGAPESALLELAHDEFMGRLKPWFFPEALELWHRLESGGVRCRVVSASADFFVKGAAAMLQVPRDRLHGIRLGVAADGLLQSETLAPVTVGDGKAELVRWVLAGEGAENGVRRFAVAALGNDFFTDGPMLEAVAGCRLPAGVPFTALINSAAPMPPPTPSPRALADQLNQLTFARRAP